MPTGSEVSTLPPGSWLGMVGGGQLGRMFCHAAQAMGYKVAVLDPDPFSPAGAVADQHIEGAYDDVSALAKLAERCPAISTEFENVPADSLRWLAQHSRVCPAGDAVALVQDRNTEKAFIQDTGVPVAPNVPVRAMQDLDRAPDELFPAILKTARLGYDGKGQARVRDRNEAKQAFESFGGRDCVLEAMVPLESELSVVMARGLDGQMVFYPPSQNEHRDGILAVATMDAELVSPALLQQAQEAAGAIAQALSYVGVLCVEFFVLADGRLLANEIAPRPHNSGHTTMDACVISQFEQQVRAMAALPLGQTRPHLSAVMVNILGDVWFEPGTDTVREPDWVRVLAVPGARLHLYGKAEARRGRKMGHVNVVGDSLETVQANAALVAEALGIAWAT